jgi:hypothetical protein
MEHSYERIFIGVVWSENLPWTYKPARESDICSTAQPILDRRVFAEAGLGSHDVESPDSIYPHRCRGTPGVSHGVGTMGLAVPYQVGTRNVVPRLRIEQCHGFDDS